MKILLICRSFHNMAGGIERMASALLNEMSARGHEMHLLTLDHEDAESFYEFHESVSWHKIGVGSHLVKASLKTKFARMKNYRKTISEIDPDTIMAFQQGTFLSARLYTLGMRYPFISAERESPGRFDHLSAGKRKNAIYQSFRLADRVTIQCETYRNEYPGYMRRKIVSIPNPVEQATQFANPKGDSSERKKLLCVGRLSYQKNQSVLLKAFEQIKNACADWDLLFAGEGEDRIKLESLSKELGIQERVTFLGAVKDTSHLYTQCHLSCLSALWEGFPNVVAESMARGLPVVGFKGCMGLDSLIEDGVNGALAQGQNNPDTLAKTLKAIMNDDSLRARMGGAAIEAMKAYEPSQVFDQFEELFEELRNEKKKRPWWSIL